MKNDVTMPALVREQLLHLVGAISGRMTFEDWYHDGADFSVLIGEPGDADPIQAEACSFAWGYLRGVAESRDETVMEMLDALAHEEGASTRAPIGHSKIRTLVTYRDAPEADEIAARICGVTLAKSKTPRKRARKGGK